jgi:hypothetical protein
MTFHISVSTAGPVNMVTADSGRRGSTQSDTSALVSSLTRDLSHSPSCSSLQMRSDTPNSYHGQVSITYFNWILVAISVIYKQ